MINWNYEPARKFERIPDGDYRLRIADIEEKPETSNSKYDYIKFIYDVSGQNAQACSYLTLNTDDPGMVNWVINLMADTFGIDLNMSDTIDFTKWIGCYGAGTIQKEGKYMENKVTHFIKQNDQYRLPGWVEGKIVEPKEELENWQI